MSQGSHNYNFFVGRELPLPNQKTKTVLRHLNQRTFI